MKKLISTFFAIVLTLLILPAVFAQDATQTEVNFNLTCNGENVVEKEADDVITVTFTLENATDETANYMINNISNEIWYDHKFFEFKGVKLNPLSMNTSTPVSFDGDHYIYFNKGMFPAVEFQAKQLIGTFEMKIIAASGSSTIRSTSRSAKLDGKSYIISSSDLEVNIGGAVAPTRYKLFFNTDGGSSIGDKLYDEGTNVDLTQFTTTKQGYTFEGWYTDSAFEAPAGNSIVLNSNTTLYAKWSKNPIKYTLTFNTGAGASQISPVTKNEGSTVSLSDYTPTKAGYTFKGWYSDEAFQNSVTSVTLDSNITVYAKWLQNAPIGGGGGGGGVVTEKEFTVKFQTNDGTAIGDINGSDGDKLDLSTYVPKKEGHDFDGWYTDPSFTHKVTEITLAADITLYAKWIEQTESGDDETQKPDEKPSNTPDIFSKEHFAYIIGRDDGKIYPDANLTRAEAATIFYRLLDEDVRTISLTNSNNFSDVNENHWFNTAVSTLASLEIINGRGNGLFEPNEHITRAELMTIVVRLGKATYEGDNLFSDIEGHWASGYINTAASIGWAKGYNGLFRPNDNITRAEAMAVINRAAGRLPEVSEDLFDGMTSWSDNSNKQAWYYLDVQEATNSHDFETKADGVHERWTALTKNPDWAKLEQ